MDTIVRELLEAAICAPSGENSQPWRFKVQENSILLYNDRSSDESLYNVHQWGTLVAHGAALENMSVAAARRDLALDIQLFPCKEQADLVARISWYPTASLEHDSKLEAGIAKRTTNRKPYKTAPLPESVASQLKSAASAFVSCDLALELVTDRTRIIALADIGGVNERIMLGNRSLHRCFFSHLSWTEEEDKEKCSGFFIPTLELPPPAVFAFRILQHWPIAWVLKALGFPSVVEKQNAQTYAAAAAIGIITAKEITSEVCVHAGQLFERLWLIATVEGLAMQPLTGALFLKQYALTKPEGELSPREQNILNERVGSLMQITGDNTPLLMFRIGYGEPPSAKSRRFPLEYFLL